MPTSLKSRLPMIAAELRSRVSEALEAGAQEIAEDAKARVPVASGDLYEAIHVESVDPATYSVMAGDEDVYYGHLVELGTVRTSPRPFLVPAAEAKKDAVADAVTAVLRAL